MYSYIFESNRKYGEKECSCEKELTINLTKVKWHKLNDVKCIHMWLNCNGINVMLSSTYKRRKCNEIILKFKNLLHLRGIV